MQEELRPKALKMFQREAERLCKFALMAHDDMHQALREDDMYRVWFSVQALLVAIGNVSKLLWPIKERIPGRGAQLRESLSVEDSSPLKDRTFRNQF